ncbi:hypothetical protein EEL42_08360 [Muribaculaceae bacterium Isolate-100 (HZI)]|nr:hypothetical protein EEL42_08360 [Muribaculaceae bacterium Isolate-100 (HZI)]
MNKFFKRRKSLPGHSASIFAIRKISIKSLFNNKCYRQGGQSASRFPLVMRELWGSITTEERAEICRRMAEVM